MKYLLKIVFATTLSLTFFSCNSDETIENEKPTITLKFKDNVESSKSSKNRGEQTYEEIIAEVNYVGGKPKLMSDNLVELQAKNSETNEYTYGYVLKSNVRESQEKNNALSRSSGCPFSIEEGFGFDGTCFVYGTFYNGSNCETLFVPCGIDCYTFGEICPGPNEAFV